MDQAGHSPLRSHFLLSPGDSRLLIVDVQEKLVPAIPVADKLIFNCRRLIDGARLFEVPVSATEQYPGGLGSTVEPLRTLIGDDRPDKVEFSCCGALDWAAEPTAGDRPKVVVAGMEAHVCVQQTVLDLIGMGFLVYVVADAVASRNKFDWKVALERMTLSGATVTTTESVLFEWCQRAGTEKFKAVSQLIRESLG